MRSVPFENLCGKQILVRGEPSGGIAGGACDGGLIIGGGDEAENRLLLLRFGAVRVHQLLKGYLL